MKTENITYFIGPKIGGGKVFEVWAESKNIINARKLQGELMRKNNLDFFIKKQVVIEEFIN